MPVDLFVITLMNSIDWAWLVIVWIWCHKRYVIYDDKFVHYRCFFGKQEIYYKDIDIEKSKYVFVAPPRDIGYASDDEVLRLTFKDGTTAKFTFYSYIWDEGIDDFTDVLWFDLKIERISDYSRVRKKKLRKKK